MRFRCCSSEFDCTENGVPLETQLNSTKRYLNDHLWWFIYIYIQIYFIIRFNDLAICRYIMDIFSLFSGSSPWIPMVYLLEIFLASGHSMAGARPEISIEVAFLDFIAPILQRFRTCSLYGTGMGWENVRTCPNMSEISRCFMETYRNWHVEWVV